MPPVSKIKMFLEDCRYNEVDKLLVCVTFLPFFLFLRYFWYVPIYKHLWEINSGRLVFIFSQFLYVVFTLSQTLKKEIRTKR